MHGNAIISPDGLYRYALGRSWGPSDKYVNFIMLNPSTADETTDDPTVRRCIQYARNWYYQGLVITNLYGYRSSEPTDLWKPSVQPLGSRNNYYLMLTAIDADMVIAAWGNGCKTDQDKHILHMIRHKGITPHHLGLTKSGNPKHPLYLGKSITPTPWKIS